MWFGAAYYPEYQPYPRLDRDIALMREAGFTVVRVGESTWSNWEPADGRFEFAAMDKALDALGEAGIGVLLGTPTYAIPPWLRRKYPEIMAIRAGGERISYGGRQNMDVTHAAYRFHAERVIRAVAGHFAAHPAVFGFQIDNEAGLELPHNPATLEHFRDWLRERYGSVQAVNEAWGLTYWSQRLGSWDDLWSPDGNTSPGYALAWRRFQAQTVTDFLAWQASIVREYARSEQLITHCSAGGHGRPAADRFHIAAVLDLPAENVYYPMGDALALPPVPGVQLAAPEWMGAGGAGPTGLYFQADLGRGAAGGGFLVTETNAASIGGAHTNNPVFDGQWRLAAYALISRGAVGVSYWHWHTIHFGHEMYWGGILGHDLEPGRCYDEVSRLGGELGRLDGVLTGLTPDARVALVYSTESRWALEFQPPLPVPGSTEPDRGSYPRIVDALYRAMFDARLPMSIVYTPALADQEALRRYPVVVVPALYVADDDLLARLVAYARDGGHLVLTFRTGYADAHGRARWQRAPGPLREAAGLSYQEYVNLAAPVPVVSEPDHLEPDHLEPGHLEPGHRFTAPAGATGQGWADGLLLEGATALARYDHPHLGRFPAITTHVWGRGRVTYVGTLPSPQLGRALARWVAAVSGVAGPPAEAWSDLPDRVRVDGARTATGERIWFAGNWSWQPTAITVPHAMRDLLSGAELAAGDELALDAWDIRLTQQLP